MVVLPAGGQVALYGRRQDSLLRRADALGAGTRAVGHQGLPARRRADLRLPGTSYKTDHCGICESVSGQYVTAIEGNTSNGNTGSQSNGDRVYRRKRKLSLLLGAYRPKYTDYRAQLQKRAGLEDKTMDYLAAYKYGADLIRKLATMKQFARFGQNSKGCVQRGHSLIHDNIFDNKTVPKHSETAQKFPLRPYLLRQNFGCWENEKTLKLQ